MFVRVGPSGPGSVDDDGTTVVTSAFRFVRDTQQIVQTNNIGALISTPGGDGRPRVGDQAPPEQPKPASPTDRQRACAVSTGAAVAGSSLGAIGSAAGLLALVPTPASPVLGGFGAAARGVGGILVFGGFLGRLAFCDGG